VRAGFLVLLAACSPYDDNLGAAPFLCGPTEPRCPEGYTCLPDNGADVCFESGSQSGDNCDDDNGLEPNDALDMATMTGVDATRSFSAEGHTICPGIDKDNFGLALAVTNEGIEIAVDFEPAQANLRASILNQTGIPIVAASSGDPATTLKAKLQNLPAGNYYVQVAGTGADIGTNHYKVTINVTGP
jgi:hypothetical protein